ncbi:MAG: hypothetical protein JOY96_12845 [Verrucomicrobia bacterium]|nr:hypothetical protein [Verrucomicrobiota bacterium]
MEAIDSRADWEQEPTDILLSEFRYAEDLLQSLAIGFSVSHATIRLKQGKPRKPPYFSCRYNSKDLGHVNIVAFFYPLLADWDQMGKEAIRYRNRIRSAIREELIHSIQVLTVKKRYDESAELQHRFDDAEQYYQYILGQVIEELASTREGQTAVLTAAQLYYEDWSITGIERLRETDRRCHGRDGYMVSELIRQLVQIRFGEMLSEEAKGSAWDKYRVFNVGDFGTAEDLLRWMAGRLRNLAPDLPQMSPTLAEALKEIEKAITELHQLRPTQGTLFESEAEGAART